MYIHVYVYTYTHYGNIMLDSVPVQGSEPGSPPTLRASGSFCTGRVHLCILLAGVWGLGV